MKKLEVCEKIWLRVRREAVRIAANFSAEDWAVALEVCPETHAAGSVRLRALVAFQWTKRRRVTLAASDMVFLGGKYTLQTPGRCVLRPRGGWSFHYVLAPKTTQLFVMTTKEKFVDFPVSVDGLGTWCRAAR